MIRPITPEDQTALMALAVSSGLFVPDELEQIEVLITNYLGGKAEPNHFWITDDDGGPVGIAYYAPEPQTQRTWNVYFIAVRPDRRGQGHGAALMGHIEQILQVQGEHFLLVETSGLPSFERTRAFYRRLGYDQVGQVPDFYKPGDDKIVFRKMLNAQS